MISVEATRRQIANVGADLWAATVAESGLRSPSVGWLPHSNVQSPGAARQCGQMKHSRASLRTEAIHTIGVLHASGARGVSTLRVPHRQDSYSRWHALPASAGVAPAVANPADREAGREPSDGWGHRSSTGTQDRSLAVAGMTIGYAIRSRLSPCWPHWRAALPAVGSEARQCFQTRLQKSPKSPRCLEFCGLLCYAPRAVEIGALACLLLRLPGYSWFTPSLPLA